MTLAERLRKVALFLENEAKDYDQDGCPEPASDCRANATELRALADYVDGRVLVGATVQRFALEQRWFATIGDSLPEYVSPSASVEEAFTDLQREIDNIDGRVMP